MSRGTLGGGRPSLVPTGRKRRHVPVDREASVDYEGLSTEWAIDVGRRFDEYAGDRGRDCRWPRAVRLSDEPFTIVTS